MKSDYILFKTDNKHYICDPVKNQFLFITPSLYFILLQHKNGIQLDSWINDIKTKRIECPKGYSRKDLIQQYRKFEFLHKHNYFGENKSRRFYFSGDNIKYYLSNTRNVTFEVTESCNLSCNYCIYGKFYLNRTGEECRTMSFDTAKNMLDFLFKYWNSEMNSSFERKISIGFYGGEALLNYNLIYQIVNYVKLLMPSYKSLVEFSMTTNGTIIEKYLPFLVENQFKVRISLDGDEKANAYRLYKDLTPTYHTIIKNIRYIRDNYPEFFKENVFFISVLHNKNSINEILDYFKTEFDKEPGVSELSTSSLNNLYQDEFWKMFNNFPTISKETDDNSITHERYQFTFEELVHFLKAHSGYVKTNYSDLLRTDSNSTYLQTGTCFPFSRMVFITAEGKILPCERIGHQYQLGYVDDTGVSMNFEQIALKYNEFFNQVSVLCRDCVHEYRCKICMFNMNVGSENFKCSEFINKSEFAEYFSSFFHELEKDPDLYLKTTKYKYV